jgi:hypothetical protein
MAQPIGVNGIFVAYLVFLQQNALTVGVVFGKLISNRRLAMKRITKHLVHLTAAQRSALQAFVSSGQKKVREITRARILLLADAGHSDAEIITALGCCRPVIWAMRKRYAEGHFNPILEVLHEAPRQGRPVRIDSRVEAQSTMLSCSDPPEGSARWTLHLIADRLVKLEMVESISHERVRQALKKTA